MNCPCCPETNLVLSERQGIEIDYCPKCRGIWLDRGELDKLIAKSNVTNQEESRYRNDDHQRPYKRKKSFFEEIFD